jgi:Fic family protein
VTSQELSSLTLTQQHFNAVKYKATKMPWTKEIIASRNALLKTHYGRFNSLVKDGPEWTRLAESGSVWDSIYNIRNKEPWMAAQEKLKKELRRLDDLREKVHLVGKKRFPLNIGPHHIRFRSNVLATFSWKSCMIENNPLSLATARRIEAAVPKAMLKSEHVFEEALKIRLPSAEELVRLDQGDAAKSDQYLELRNNIVATQAALSSRHLQRATKPEGLLKDIRTISRILFLDTKVHFKAGELRTLPIQVHSDPKAIFPYPQELRQNLRRWTDFVVAAGSRNDGEIHPLLKAAWDSFYYVSIHPFQDGNGRTSRILFATHVAKNGMLPVICSEWLPREQYLRNIALARSGNPFPWCHDLVRSQIAALEEIGGISSGR